MAACRVRTIVIYKLCRNVEDECRDTESDTDRRQTHKRNIEMKFAEMQP